MKYRENIAEVTMLHPDFIGFNFYNRSSRYVGNNFEKKLPDQLGKNVKRVGVFVNSRKQKILETVHSYQLSYVQLHGNESPEFCNDLSEKVSVIKAFGIDETFSFNHLSAYEAACELFVFDTATKKYGGSGTSYNWNLLSRYKGNTPYLLSGGIGPTDLNKINNHRQLLNDTHCIGLDLNSKFELEPALKNVHTLKEFLNQLKNENTIIK